MTTPDRHQALATTGDDRGFTACFDHVALALHRMTDGWPILAEALGGRFRTSGLADGYSWMQLGFANGFTVETLHPEELPEPEGSGESKGPAEPTAGSGPDGPGLGSHEEGRRPDHRGDFVRRFLDRAGAGPHHLTFTVTDLDAALSSLRREGLEPGVVDRSDPGWQEALFSARVAHGMVLQVVETGDGRAEPTGPPEGFPELGYDHPIAGFGRAVLAAGDPGAALGLFRDGLGGRVTSTGSDVDGNHWVELGWRGPGRLRLLEAASAEVAEWVGGRPGRLQHLYFTFDDPQSVPGARKVATGRWVVEPDDTLGVRLVIASTVR